MKEDKLTSAFRKIKARFAGLATSDDNVQDSLQEAFCRLWASKDSISDNREAEGKLTVTARNIRIDMLRRRAVHPELDISSIKEPPDIDFHDDLEELYQDVSDLISRHLTDRDREILLRRDRDGWDFEDIAQCYSISEANARVIIARSRKKIREIYRNQNHRL